MLVAALALTPLAAGIPIALAPGDAAPVLEGRPLGARGDAVVDWKAARLTVVNFWATWCLPCRDEIPKLQKIFSAREGDGLGVIGVYDQDSKPEVIFEYLEPMGVTYPILKAHRDVDRNWGGIGAWPTTFLVDSEGKILRRYVGARPEQTEGLIADIEAVLDGRPLGPMVLPGSWTDLEGTHEDRLKDQARKEAERKQAEAAAAAETDSKPRRKRR